MVKQFLALIILAYPLLCQECDVVEDGSLNVVDIVQLIWIIIEDPPPEASFTANPNTGMAPLEISFNNTSFLGAREFYYYEWDFSDGSPILGYEHPIHTYNYAGDYNACLTISTEMGDYSHCEIISVSGTSTVVDIDGNIYNTVLIGNQEWMAENLKVTHFQNGDPIDYAWTSNDWQVEQPSYCYFFNLESNGEIYGGLYNGFVVNDDREVCPEGWHVPSDEEFMFLEVEIGMDYNSVQMEGFIDRGDVGGKLKEIGIEHWEPPNEGATNEYGFTAFGGGDRQSNGSFSGYNRAAYFFTSTPYSTNEIWTRGLGWSNVWVYRLGVPNALGSSIRCLKD